jgi:hypothetical protein
MIPGRIALLLLLCLILLPDGKVPKFPLISMGKQDGDDQSILKCLVLNSRSAGGWAAIHVHENCSGIRIEDNIVFNSGLDVRGNGRAGGELPLGWGDVISTAGRNSIVRNNRIEALGSRIHIGMPMGGPVWGNYFAGTTLVGARVENNSISGEAAGYGYAAMGIDSFIIRGNTSTAVYSGRGDGLPGNPPGAFLYEPEQIGNSILQADFKPKERHLVHLMRNFYKPVNSIGYRTAPYGEPEAKATIRWAYLEIVKKSDEWPSAAEMYDQILNKILNDNKSVIKPNN